MFCITTVHHNFLLYLRGMGIGREFLLLVCLKAIYILPFTRSANLWKDSADEDERICPYFCVFKGIYPSFFHLQYLIFGKTLLMKTKDLLFQGRHSSIDGVRSMTWWVARAFFLHQKLLDERSSFLYDLLQVYMKESLVLLGTLEKINEYWSSNEDCSTILSLLHLEVGILELYYGRVDASK